MPVKML